MKTTFLTMVLILGALLTRANSTGRQTLQDTTKPLIKPAAKIHTDTDSIPGQKQEVIFQKVEGEASFPGGQSEYRKFMERNLNPSVPVDHGAPAGTYTVVVEFLVDTDGTISKISPLTSHGYGMEEEVVRFFQKSPRWQPAMQNGRVVKSSRKQPVTFAVTEEYRPKKKNKKRD